MLTPGFGGGDTVPDTYADSQQQELAELQACRAGDMRAWESMVGRHQNALRCLAARLLGAAEADDIVQETFLRAFRSLASFRGDCRVSTWLYRITVNLCRDKARSHLRRNVAFSLDEPILAEEGRIGRQLADPNPNPQEQAESNELSSQVNEALRRLPEVHRTVVVLHDIHGLRYDEVAQVMGCSLGTVKSRLFYARRKLGKLLAPYCQD